jgi:hypothetical protein
MITFRTLHILLVALASVTALIAAQPALASDLRDIRTADANPGGKGYLIHRDGKLILGACDIHKDGFGVLTYASNIPGSLQNLVQDRDGSNNGPCHERVIQFATGLTVWVTVCLKDRGSASAVLPEGVCDRVIAS